MTEQDTLKKVLTHNNLLTESNLGLVQMLMASLEKQKQFDTYIKESFQALDDKENRTIQQEVEYQYLKRILIR